MEDEPGTRAVEPVPAAENPNSDAVNGSKSREEGELSSSDDDELAAQVAPENENNEGAKAISGTSVQLNNRMSTDKDRAPFVPFVISFSDDDSDSDHEEFRQTKALGSKSNTMRVDGKGRPLSSSQIKSQMLCRTTRNKTKVMPKKVSLSRTFVTSINKINAANSSSGGCLLFEQRSQFRGTNALDSKSVGAEPGSKKTAQLNSTKLQDLRQQIALREQELKLKSLLQNREAGLGSSRDHNVVDSNNYAAGKHKRTAADFVQFELKEPNKKRLKLSEALSCQQTSNMMQEIPAIESTLPSEKAVLDILGEQRINVHSHGDKETHLDKPISAQRNNDTPGSVSSGNLSSGAGLIVNESHTNRNKKPLKPSISLDQSVRMPNTIARTFSKKSASLNNASLCNCLDMVIISQGRDSDMQSLLDIEELQEKELEAAQEHRRKCEIEERNALKAYRAAQRALIEANARCTLLYQKRELYSAKFRSLMMENSSLSRSSMLQNHVGTGLDSSSKIPSVNAHHFPISCHQGRGRFEVHNEQICNSNALKTNDALQNVSDQHLDTQDLGCCQCNEHDSSTSEPRKDNSVANAVHSRSSDVNVLGDENDDTFSFENRSANSGLDCHIKVEHYEERKKHTCDEPSRNFLADSSQDSLLLEANLRSQLFAKLGMKTLSDKRNTDCEKMSRAETGTEQGGSEEKAEINTEIYVFAGAEENQHSAFGGADAVEKSISGLPAQLNECHVEKLSSNYASPSADPMDTCSLTNSDQSAASVTFLCPTLRSAFGHIRVFDSARLRIISKQVDDYDTDNETGNSNGSDEIQPSIPCSKPMNETSIDIYAGNMGSDSFDLAIDPSWPLCMFELRGKCNNDECSWQHVRDYSCRAMNNEDSNSADNLVRPLLGEGNIDGATDTSKGIDRLHFAPPTYIICIDSLEFKNHSSGSVLVRSIGQCWKRCFSYSLVLSGLLPIDFTSSQPSLHGTDACIEVKGSWDRKSLYFKRRNATMKQSDPLPTDSDQVLEMAFFHLNQEVNKRKGRIEALKVLARALEASPTTAVLWVVYLHIYYSAEKSIGKDDLYQCAVESTEGSYELWLLYINSRTKLEDQMVAYDTALSGLCRHGYAHYKDAVHVSACVLDLFLQFVNCLSISGNVGKAIEKIYGLFLDRMNCHGPQCLLFSDILACLTLYHKCVFWVCCVYFLVYKKLPDGIVQQFELEKRISEIEWSSAHLASDEKEQAVRLMEMAVDSLAKCMDSGSLENETTLEAAHYFALNHVMCIQILQGQECGRNLLDKYTKLYPSSLELVLLSARIQVDDSGDLNFQGFEEVLSNWPEEFPGVQCIWNQYAEWALKNGKFDFTKGLMDRWYRSVWKVQYPQYGTDDTDGQSLIVSQDLPPALDSDALISSRKSDIMFGLLNLSLYKLFQDDGMESRLAVDRALKVAAAKDYKHCVKEHAMFLLADGSLPEGISCGGGGILSILKGYLVDARAFQVSEPLPRKFIESIKKPRVRQLVSNIWSPQSSDFSLVNMVLETWHGKLLLPPILGELKDMVDMVENIMEILPCNYQLAISVCKHLSKQGKSSKVTSASVSFWVSSLLISALFRAVPVAPEYVWVEAATVLRSLPEIQSLSESFHKRALLVYPFSIKLWKSYLDLSSSTRATNSVIEAAREHGIKLD